jgi:hypothetical protein
MIMASKKYSITAIIYDKKGNVLSTLVGSLIFRKNSKIDSYNDFSELPELTINSYSSIGDDNVFGRYTVIEDYVTFSNRNVFNGSVEVGDNVVFGDKTHFKRGVSFGSNCRVGDECVFDLCVAVQFSNNFHFGVRLQLGSYKVISLANVSYATDDGSIDLRVIVHKDGVTIITTDFIYTLDENYESRRLSELLKESMPLLKEFVKGLKEDLECRGFTNGW